MLKNVLQIFLVCVSNGVFTGGQMVSGQNLVSLSSKWSTNLLQDKISVIALKTIEPGFDFTDEEMTKLKLWPHGVISYYIDDFSFDKVLRDRIRSYLDGFSGLTGLRFLELPSPPLDDKERWVLFVNRRGMLACADHSTRNFSIEGVQRVILGYDCITNGGELGEVALAIAGVPAQHNSPDRDDYITVQMNNIIPAKRYLFKKVEDSEWLFHDIAYDFTSVSHYHFHKHSIDGSATIVPKEPETFQVGEGEGLSYTDVLKVRMLYNYISKKKYYNPNENCSKLFKLKPNIGNNQKEEKIAPRKKPKKYFGSSDDIIDAVKIEDKVNNESQSAEYQEDDKKVKEESETEENDSLSKSKEKSNDTEVVVVTTPIPENAPGASDPQFLKADIFSRLSDYDTDDTRSLLGKSIYHDLRGGSKKKPKKKLRNQNNRYRKESTG